MSCTNSDGAKIISLAGGLRVWWTWPLPDQPAPLLRVGIVLADQSEANGAGIMVIEEGTGQYWQVTESMNLHTMDKND